MKCFHDCLARGGLRSKVVDLRICISYDSTAPFQFYSVTDDGSSNGVSPLNTADFPSAIFFGNIVPGCHSPDFEWDRRCRVYFPLQSTQLTRIAGLVEESSTIFHETTNAAAFAELLNEWSHDLKKKWTIHLK